MKKLIIGGATVNQTPLDWAGNLQNILESIGVARDEEIDLLCFPELCITAYGCEDLFLSEWLPDKAISLIPEIVEFTEAITIAVGLPIRFMGKTYNCVCVISDRKILGITAKQYLAIDGVHYESRWFTQWPANTIDEIELMGQNVPFGDVTYKKDGISFGFEICEDAWREDRPGNRLFERKVDLILNPSASHFALQKTLDRQHLVVESSRKFNCTYLYVNLLGNESGRMIYDGEIIIADRGKLLNKNNHLSFLPFQVLRHEIDFESDIKEISSFHEVLSKDEEFTRATSLGLFDYLRKSNASGFVLSLSGGADSSTCAVLISEMVRRGIKELGVNNFLEKIGKSDLIDSTVDDYENNTKLILSHLLITAYQATKNSSKETLEAAKELAENIGARFIDWKIDNAIEDYTSTIELVLGRKLNWSQDDIALQNIQARARSPIIWMLANLKNSLLITTSNRSEGDVGYATMDGDTSGSLAPIAAIDKPFIRKWLIWAEKELGYEALSNVNQLEPTAELRPLEKAQTDEEDLMPYNILVEIERAAIRDHKSPVQVFEVLVKRHPNEEEALKTYVHRFFSLWSKNQWKRERIAPSFHLDDFNIDPKTWCRFPIISGGFKEELDELDQM
jgi:NAD+ synthase (glutamine-hydrolysing)